MIGEVHYVMEWYNGDGTNYNFCIYEDPYGGFIITCPLMATYRAYIRYFLDEEDQKQQLVIEMKFLHGNKNKYTMNAMSQCMIELVQRGVIDNEVTSIV